MVCGWAKGVWVSLALVAAPLRVTADFVHIVPLNPSAKSADSVVPPSSDGVASPSDTVTTRRQISTESDPQAVAAPEPSREVINESGAPADSVVPQVSQTDDNSTVGVHPIALNSTAVNPNVPEPSMLTIGLMASMGLLTRRRRAIVHGVSADRA